MEENVQELLKDKNEDVVQFNFENNTSSPVAIDLFDTASLLTIPTSGTQTTSYQNTQIPINIGASTLSYNSNSGILVASEITLAGALRFINTSTNTTNNNFDNVGGFNSSATNITTQPDGKILVGGGFTTYKSVSANRIIRLNSDGTIDSSFIYGTGFNSPVRIIVVQPDGKILCGGNFSTYKGLTDNNCIIRLNSDGTKDLTFDNSIGFDNIVTSIAIQPDGKILVGGAFNTYKGVSANRIIRLNSDGSIDLTFNSGTGFNNDIFKLSLQSDGKILCGGTFTSYNGLSENYIIRLNSDGTKDITFDNSIGFNGATSTIAIQPDGKILIGGLFGTYKGVSANGIIRLNSDGSIDSSFIYGTGFNNFARVIKIQFDGKILVGGSFTTYNSINENFITRLNSDGSIDLTFDNSIGFNQAIFDMSIDSNNDILLVGNFNLYKNFQNNRIIKINTFGYSISYLSLQSAIFKTEYCSTNDTFYSAPQVQGTPVCVIEGNGQSIISTFLFPNVNQKCQGLSYNANNNCMYFLTNNNTLLISEMLVLDCNTNIFIASIPLSNFNVSGLSNITSANVVYYWDEDTLLLQKVDCNTNTLVLINLSLPNMISNVTSLNLNPLNNNLYCMSYQTLNAIDVVDTLTDTYLTSIIIPISYIFAPVFSAINPVTNQLFVTDFNNTTSQQYAIIDCSTNTLLSVETLSSNLQATYGVIYAPNTNSMYISGSLFSVVTFTATPFFIGGSTNYNTFVNNLNFEPIFVDEIRILTQNQTQLYNQVQFTKIDSNGNQIFFPEFPITKVDSYQQQGNIAGLQLNGLVFDGRTYINQYVINANQIVSFEIYYKQLDRFSATPTYPIFFKEKVQLKEYIRKDYNNYDVEM